MGGLGGDPIQERQSGRVVLATHEGSYLSDHLPNLFPGRVRKGYPSECAPKASSGTGFLPTNVGLHDQAPNKE